MGDEPTLIAIAVVEDNGRFLVGVRPSGVALAGYHEFPGGKVEAGEPPEHAAVRECLEETGLLVEVVDTFREQTHDYRHDRVRLLFFHCRLTQIDAKQIAARPTPPFRWVERSELNSLQFPAANAAVLALLQAGTF